MHVPYNIFVDFNPLHGLSAFKELPRRCLRTHPRYGPFLCFPCIFQSFRERLELLFVCIYNLMSVFVALFLCFLPNPLPEARAASPVYRIRSVQQINDSQQCLHNLAFIGCLCEGSTTAGLERKVSRVIFGWGTRMLNKKTNHSLEIDGCETTQRMHPVVPSLLPIGRKPKKKRRQRTRSQRGGGPWRHERRGETDVGRLLARGPFWNP